MPVPKGGGEIGRPKPGKLEIEVVTKFMKHDRTSDDIRREKYPHLVKDAHLTKGKGSVQWVGLNPDPCKAKYLLKSGITFEPPEPRKNKGRPQSVPSATPARRPTASMDDLHRIDWEACAPDYGTMENIQSRQGTPAYRSSTPAMTRPQSRQATPSRPSSVAQKRDLSKLSWVNHFLEQRMVLPGILPQKHFTTLGAYPTTGAQKPDDLEELIYSGVSHNHEGRFAYLGARALMDPQQRTDLPATSAQEIAWRVKEGKPAMCLNPVAGLAACTGAPGGF